MEKFDLTVVSLRDSEHACFDSYFWPRRQEVAFYWDIRGLILSPVHMYQCHLRILQVSHLMTLAHHCSKVKTSSSPISHLLGPCRGLRHHFAGFRKVNCMQGDGWSISFLIQYYINYVQILVWVHFAACFMQWTEGEIQLRKVLGDNKLNHHSWFCSEEFRASFAAQEGESGGSFHGGLLIVLNNYQIATAQTITQ